MVDGMGPSFRGQGPRTGPHVSESESLAVHGAQSRRRHGGLASFLAPTSGQPGLGGGWCCASILRADPLRSRRSRDELFGASKLQGLAGAMARSRPPVRAYAGFSGGVVRPAPGHVPALAGGARGSLARLSPRVCAGLS